MTAPLDQPGDAGLVAIAAQLGIDARGRLDLWRERYAADRSLTTSVRSAALGAAVREDGMPPSPSRRSVGRIQPFGAARGMPSAPPAHPVPSWSVGPAGIASTRVSAALEIIDRQVGMNAFTSVWPEEARAAANALDARARRGERMGRLYGAVVAVKDLMAVRGHTVSAGTRAFESSVSVDDATVVGRLRAADAVIVGLTNLHALAYGPFSDSTDLGPVGNPLCRDVVAGGSSGGSAAAVAMGAVDVAIGTDTAGSIRMPAALCGVVGLKGGYAAASTRGVFPLAPSLDHVGPIGRTVQDVAVAWEVMAAEPFDASTTVQESLEGVVIGDLRHYVRDHLDDEVRAALESALEAARRLGARIEPVSVPDLDRAPGAMLCTMGPEALDVHRELLVRRADLLPADVRLRLEMGAFVTGADYVRAARLRGLLRMQLCDVLARVDVLLLPSLPIVAPLRHALDAPVAGGRWTTRSLMTRFTVLANLTGHPAVSLPWARDARGAGIGIQLVGGLQREDDLLAVAGALEREKAPPC